MHELLVLFSATLLETAVIGHILFWGALIFLIGCGFESFGSVVQTWGGALLMSTLFMFATWLATDLVLWIAQGITHFFVADARWTLILGVIIYGLAFAFLADIEKKHRYCF